MENFPLPSSLFYVLYILLLLMYDVIIILASMKKWNIKSKLLYLNRV